MPLDNKNELTLEELKTIIHGLRMSTLSFVEDGALSEINSMIKMLPLPEEIDKLTRFPKAVKNVQNDIGNIMRLIELYGKRDVEFKTRYVSRTSLPPRYKVLEWRGNMKTDAKIIRDIVKVSSDVDSKGHGELSGRINKFASNILQDKFDETEFEKIAMSLKESGLEKEAQFWQGVKGFMGGALGKAKEMATDLWQTGKAGGLEAQYAAIYKQLEVFKGKVGQLVSQARDPNLKQRMQSLFQAIQLGEEQMNKAATDVKNASSQTAQQPAQQAAPASAAGNIQQTLTSLQSALNMPGLDKYQQNAIQQAIKALQRNQQPAVSTPSESTPVTTPAAQPVTASSKFNLRMYKSACAK